MMIISALTGLPPHILPTIKVVEGGRVGLVHMNSNGTADLGVMQVNSIWVPVLAAHARMTDGVTRSHLIYDGCFNIAAAALIIRYEIHLNHGAILPAIGDYHSWTPALSKAYLKVAEATAQNIFGQ